MFLGYYHQSLLAYDVSYLSFVPAVLLPSLKKYPKDRKLLLGAWDK